MSHHHHPPPPPPLLPIIFSLLLLFSLLPALPALPVVLPNPDPATLPQQQQTFHPNPTPPPATIPSFPEQSAAAACPIRLPDELFSAVKTSCVPGHLSRSTCCPVLAAWLYSAYSDTALGLTSGSRVRAAAEHQTASYDEIMPLLPDDSETCLDGLEKMMREKGVNLEKPNATCDVVYCYCGIRLHHPLSCPQAFSVSEEGNLVGGECVKKLERDCLNGSNGTENGNRFSTSLAHCSKCLSSLYSLKKGKIGGGNATRSSSEGRTKKMRSRDCELMGLTWLLNINRDAYMPTVTAVMRALMMNKEGSDPKSCSLDSDGMPLAVDSVEIDGQSSSVALKFPNYSYLFFLFLLILSLHVLS